MLFENVGLSSTGAGTQGKCAAGLVKVVEWMRVKVMAITGADFP